MSFLAENQLWCSLSEEKTEKILEENYIDSKVLLGIVHYTGSNLAAGELQALQYLSQECRKMFFRGRALPLGRMRTSYIFQFALPCTVPVIVIWRMEF